MQSIVRGLSLVALVPLVFGGCSSASPSPSMAPAPAATLAQSAIPTPAIPSNSPTPSAATVPTADGQIVFEDAGQDFQYSQVWIENADGSNLRKLASDEYTDSGPSLSPDGERVVFYQGYPASLEKVLADPSLFGRIMLVNVDGSGLHELETGNRVNRCDAGPEGDAWSPDGTRIAYATACFDKSGNGRGTGIWTINADGTDAHEVTRTGPVKYLGDGTWAPHLEDHRAGWSPDGKRLVFERIDTSAAPERAAIFTVGTNGMRLRQVTPWTLDANDPVWSPDGSLIAFNSPAEPARDQNIFTIHPDGTGLTQLTHNDEEGQATFHPSWSPDGRQILFSHSPSTDGWGDLYVMDADGTNLHVLARTRVHENHADWGASPSS